jgi:pimeloyl-ACP methyl ester carboxylesterase
VSISERDDARRPSAFLLLREGAALAARFWRGFGKLGERGPVDGPPLMVVPGFLATDRTTLGLQRALAAAGYRVTGWGMGMNRGVRAETLEELAERIGRHGRGRPVILVGWSLGGIYAREVAKARPDLVEKVVTLGSPFSGDPRANNAWRLYERVAGHPVDNPPVEARTNEKPPVPTLAVWSRRDGIVAPASSRGTEGESDRQVELDCGHMDFGVSGRAFPKIVAAIRAFS